MRDLEDIRGAHAGRPAVVAGSGPSLAKSDDRIYRCVVIAVRAAILSLEHADYFMSNDPTGAYTKWWDVLLHERKCPAIVPFPTDCPPDRIIKYKQRTNPKDWSIDPESSKIVMLSSSAHCAVHLAAVMGCSPIYLIGCDCRRSENGNMYAWENSGDERGAPKPEHAERMSGFMRAGTHVEPWYHIPAWRQVVDHNPGLKLYDVSGAGLVGVVAQASYEDLASGVLDDAPHPGKPKRAGDKK